MKLIQLNAWCGRIVSPLAQFLKDEKPDLLCLQELVDLPGGDDVVFLTLEEIQAACGLSNSFLSPVFSFNFLRRRAMFANGILSRFPIIKSETIFTHGDFLDNLDYLDDSSNMRNLQHAVADLPEGKTLHLLNHHGYHVHQHKNGNEETLRQCKEIADYAAQLSGPIILTGDFNLVPHSPSIAQINQVLRNLPLESGAKTTRTVLTNKTEVCDYIFVNDEVKVKEFSVSEKIVSDHCALILEFELV